MRMPNLDWSSVASKAEGQTTTELLGALSDIFATLESADDLDRLDNGNRGGYYRDEASVIHKELKKRGVHNA